MPFAATWMDLEIVILSEVSQRKTNLWHHLYVEFVFKGYKWTYIQNRNRVTDVENNLMVISGERGGGINWEVGIHICACGLSSFSCVRLLVILWTLAHQATLSMGFSWQHDWKQDAIPFSRGSSWPRDRTRVSESPVFAGKFFTTEPPGKQLKSQLKNCI